MKKLIKLFSFVLVLFVFFSCQNDDELNNTEQDKALEAFESEAAYEELTDEVDEIAFFASFVPGEEQRISEPEKSPIHCAIRTHDEENKTIVIDFGEGCEDYFGRVRAGKIIITYTDHFYIPGAVITLTFDNFYISGVQIEGVRTITNLSETLADYLTFDIRFEDGKFIWPDGSFRIREAHWVVTRIRAANPINDEKHIDGSASGTTKNGIAYSVEILETIVFKRECGPLHVFLPVQGIKEISWNNRVRTIDYGDGECDREVRIITDGQSREITLNSRLGNN